MHSPRLIFVAIVTGQFMLISGFVMDHAILLGKTLWGSVLNLVSGSSPIYLTVSNKRLLMELNLISVI